jgi:hypothetical protein
MQCDDRFNVIIAVYYTGPTDYTGRVMRDTGAHVMYVIGGVCNRRRRAFVGACNGPDPYYMQYM